MIAVDEQSSGVGFAIGSISAGMCRFQSRGLGVGPFPPGTPVEGRRQGKKERTQESKARIRRGKNKVVRAREEYQREIANEENVCLQGTQSFAKGHKVLERDTRFCKEHKVLQGTQGSANKGHKVLQGTQRINYLVRKNVCEEHEETTTLYSRMPHVDYLVCHALSMCCLSNAVTAFVESETEEDGPKGQR